jgi:hypothetical protein
MSLVVTPTIYESDKFVSDNEQTIIDNIELHHEDTIRLFGAEIDIKTLQSSLFSLFLLFIILYYTGIIKEIYRDKIILALIGLLISVVIFDIFSASTFAASLSLEQTRLIVIDQMSAVLTGSILLFLYVLTNSGTTLTKNKNATYLAVIALLLSILNTLKIGFKYTGNDIRTIRKCKEAVINVSIILFAMAVYLAVK